MQAEGSDFINQAQKDSNVDALNCSWHLSLHLVIYKYNDIHTSSGFDKESNQNIFIDWKFWMYLLIYIVLL